LARGGAAGRSNPALGDQAGQDTEQGLRGADELLLGQEVTHLQPVDQAGSFQVAIEQKGPHEFEVCYYQVIPIGIDASLGRTGADCGGYLFRESLASEAAIYAAASQYVGGDSQAAFDERLRDQRMNEIGVFAGMRVKVLAIHDIEYSIPHCPGQV
jgi:hypothetical protein